jgi:hypothetical protein
LGGGGACYIFVTGRARLSSNPFLGFYRLGFNADRSVAWQQKPSG